MDKPNKPLNTPDSFETPEQRKQAAKDLQKAAGGVPEGSSKVRRIKLSDIEINQARQPRVSMDKDYVAEIVDAITDGKNIPPIDVYSINGEAPYYLSDGRHRHEANDILGYKEIDALVHTGTAFDAFKASLGANADHGKRRTNADKHRAVTLAFEDSELSKSNDGIIAEICKVSRNLVTEIRKQVFKSKPDEKGSNEPENGKTEDEPEKRTGKDGKSYPAKNKRTAGERTPKQATAKEDKQDLTPPSVRKDIEWGKEMQAHTSVLHTTLTRKDSPYKNVPKSILKALVTLNKCLELGLSEDGKSAVQKVAFPED